MLKSTSLNQDIGLLLLRLVLGGFMMFGHGLGKLTNFTELADKFPDPLGLGSLPSLGLAVFAEFFCALLVVLGYRMRLALIPLIITMAVAGFLVHFDDPFGKKELAFLYLGGYIALFFLGTGRYAFKERARKN